MSDARFILEGTARNFDQLVIENSRKGLVLVDFWAPWVGPSLRQREMLIGLAREYDGRFLLVSVNTDEQKSLAQRFAVRSLPNLKIFRHGEMVAEYHGVQPEADYPRIIEQYVTKPLDQASQQAVTAWQAGDVEQALRLLAEASLEEPLNLGYPALMGKILMREGREDDAYELLNALPPEAQSEPEIRRLLSHLSLLQAARQADDLETLRQRVADNPNDPENRYQLAASLLTQDQFEPALEHLLYLTQHHAQYRNGIARKNLQALLEMLDPTDAQVARYRRALYRLNY